MYGLIIADDEEIVRRGLKRNIKWAKYGFRVLDDAPTGKAALDLVVRMEPDLLITDIRMPDMSGLEVLKRAKYANESLEVIIVSAYDLFEYARQALAYDAAGYLLKPVEEAELDAVMDKVLSRIGRTRTKGPRRDGMQSADIVERARRYITDNYTTKLTLEDVAEACFTNPSYLSTVFKNKTGCSFVEFVSEIRIRQAKALLENSGYKVKDIAYRVGYDDYTYFCKVFKKNTGCTPLEYRCRIR